MIKWSLYYPHSTPMPYSSTSNNEKINSRIWECFRVIPYYVSTCIVANENIEEMMKKLVILTTFDGKRQLLNILFWDVEK